MTTTRNRAGIASGRLQSEDYARNFADLHPLLEPYEAKVEADRCYFCHDAPCMQACPTSIDIPLFIRQIATGDRLGSAETILKSNILGGFCARVCPTETLCEEVCVRNLAEERPVEIGRLQRFATDHAMAEGTQFFTRATASGKRVAIVGAGPAGLACAHALACAGHAVTLFDSRAKAGGLNEYGIAAYKTVENFAQREVDYILGIGGITLETGRTLGADLTFERLRLDFDALFLALGLAGVKRLGIQGERLAGVHDAVDYIAELRQASDLADLPVGRSVVVIGGGMTAIDISLQTKRLGARDVTLVYRRGPEAMKASAHEQHLAQTSGVAIKHWAVPKAIEGDDGAATGVTFERVAPGADGKLEATGEVFTLAADQVFKAVGQSFLAETLAGSGLKLSGGRIHVDQDRKTSLKGVWAGGDCIAGGEELTVAAVEDGKRAARDIHHALSGAS